MEVVVDQDKQQRGKGRAGTLENPETYENVPGHIIPIIEREFDDFDNEAEQFLSGELEENQFIGFRLKQGVYGQRQPDVQMIRVKLPFGGVTPEQMDAFASVVEKYAPLEQGPHHDPPEHPDPPRAAARHRAAAARDRRGRPLLARGLRQHDPQRHRRPLGRRRPRRGLRPDALRRRLRPLLRPPPDDAADAAQDQDLLHRLRRRPRDQRHPRHRLPRPRAGRGQGLRDPGRRRHLDHGPRRADPLRVRRGRQRRLPQGRRGRAAHLRPPGVAARQPRPRPDQGPDRQDRHRRLPRAGRRGARGRLGRRSASSTPSWSSACATTTTRRRTRPPSPPPPPRPTATAPSSSASSKATSRRSARRASPRSR